MDEDENCQSGREDTCDKPTNASPDLGVLSANHLPNPAPGRDSCCESSHHEPERQSLPSVMPSAHTRSRKSGGASPPLGHSSSASQSFLILLSPMTPASPIIIDDRLEFGGYGRVPQLTHPSTLPPLTEYLSPATSLRPLSRDHVILRVRRQECAFKPYHQSQ